MENENIEKKTKRKIAFGTLVGYLVLAINLLYGILITPLIISICGESDYGVYTLAVSFIALFLVDFGLGVTADVFLARYKAENDTDSSNRFTSITFKLFLILDLIFAIVFTILYFFIEKIYVGLNYEECKLLKTMYVITSISGLLVFPSAVFNGVLSSNEDFTLIKVLTLISRLILIVGTIISLFTEYKIIGIAFSHLISNFFILTSRFIFAKFKYKAKFNIFVKTSYSEIKPILAFSIWAAVTAIFSRLIFNIMPSVLGITANSSEVALFGIAASLEGYIYTLSTVLNGVFLPKLYRIKENFKDNPSLCVNEVNDLSKKVGLLQTLIILIVFIGFLTCGKEFINLWLDNRSGFYDNIFFCVILLVIYQIIYTPQIIFYTYIYTQKSGIKYLGIISIVKAFINCILAFLLTIYFGALGACISVSICRIVELSILNILYIKKFNFDIFGWMRFIIAKTIIPFLVCLLGGLLFHFLLPLSELYKLIIIVLWDITSFCVLFWIFIGKDYRGTYCGIFRSILKK